MTKHAAPHSPSKAQMAKEERRYRAEGMVRDAMTNNPTFSKAVKKAEQQLVKVETVVKAVVKGKKK